MRNISVARIIFALIIIFLASIYLPEFYWKITKSEGRGTFVFYSPVKNDFLLLSSDVHGVKYFDRDEKEYTREEFESALPLFYYRQLVVSGKMPDSLHGHAMDPKELQLNSLYLKIKPADINLNTIQLFPLFESQSGRVNLELPPDYFRITDRMEFITAINNTVDEEKSRIFTEALNKAGFSFPAKKIYGNPSTRKAFDEGYFVIDNKNEVFHIKMVKDEPVCIKTGIPDDLDIVFMLVQEMELREFYGIIITGNSDVYLISYDNYKLIKLPMEDYNYSKCMFTLRGDLLYRSISIYDEDSNLKTIVTDRDYKVIDKYEEESSESEAEEFADKAASFIFPFEIAVEHYSTPMIDLYFDTHGFQFIFLSIVLMGVTFFFLKKKKASVRSSIVYYLLVLLTGIYGFIAVLCIRDFDSGSNI